ncbi:MAG TPA: hypothetical protein VG603_16635, partial [Chitinophagales bacterium]|nr:hypothetical protein [Chitinophagales bacterium]
MKKLILLVTFTVSLLALRAQTQLYGNEWIDYSQPHYYKIKIWKDGMYRLQASTLSGIIPNLGGVNVNNIALFHNGQQVPLYISSSTTLSSTDYIDFYGQKNIGDVDSSLYRSADLQPHPYYSLFTDTSIYYLTVTSSVANKRYVEVVNDL